MKTPKLSYLNFWRRVARAKDLGNTLRMGKFLRSILCLALAFTISSPAAFAIPRLLSQSVEVDGEAIQGNNINIAEGQTATVDFIFEFQGNDPDFEQLQADLERASTTKECTVGNDRLKATFKEFILNGNKLTIRCEVEGVDAGQSNLSGNITAEDVFFEQALTDGVVLPLNVLNGFVDVTVTEDDGGDDNNQGDNNQEGEATVIEDVQATPEASCGTLDIIQVDDNEQVNVNLDQFQALTPEQQANLLFLGRSINGPGFILDVLFRSLADQQQRIIQTTAEEENQEQINQVTQALQSASVRVKLPKKLRKLFKLKRTDGKKGPVFSLEDLIITETTANPDGTISAQYDFELPVVVTPKKKLFKELVPENRDIQRALARGETVAALDIPDIESRVDLEVIVRFQNVPDSLEGLPKTIRVPIAFSMLDDEL